ncbi:hypothetical protein Rhe02_80240 [Rhizocola hellebori]|uniref:Uncharacterized protein n=1 Tax=Rhizocola hellebori TaxID=1392758 RepID=A0A8J3VKW4_9ACTN|nr:hypothetical protein [Rhizocola hellebori]GIH09957.1 hypothetical protein Rhe02_80240 [Rhizocola hellebori]
MMKAMRRLARTAPGPLAVRGIVFFAAAAGIWIAAPTAFVSLRFLLPILISAAMPALLPNSRVVGATMVFIVGLWMVATLAFGEPATPGRTFLAACALYLTHSAATLAAMLPHDAIVDNQVIIRWAGRTAMVIGSSGVVTIVVVVAAPGLTPTTSIFALLGGLAVVVGLVAVLARSAGIRRR